MVFTKEDYLKIEDWLKHRSVKDSEFPTTEEITEDTLIPVIQDGNKCIPSTKFVTSITSGVEDVIEEKVKEGLKDINRLAFTGFYIEQDEIEVGFNFLQGIEQEGEFSYYIPMATPTTWGFMSQEQADKLNKSIWSIYTETYSHQIVFKYIKNNSGVTSFVVRGATETKAGLMTAADKTKLDSIVILAEDDSNTSTTAIMSQNATKEAISSSVKFETDNRIAQGERLERSIINTNTKISNLRVVYVDHIVDTPEQVSSEDNGQLYWVKSTKRFELGGRVGEHDAEELENIYEFDGDSYLIRLENIYNYSGRWYAFYNGDLVPYILNDNTLDAIIEAKVNQILNKT